ncbi:nucleotidyltransferase [Ligilactobacillus ceti]|uniref:tRNA(Met) cytidine acetate ligase n=1 Tax=Ligilactobacillus ceti DSM 22408 TaxID=1122146 RepID=A0A0R2KGY8_9LACO|nr:nucleotidyltransferase [Ligilactobacillus ceti]KRN88539.1 hypothetical protein IV53_GL000503 [Ligilactobacillus ceti DSM 22408]
MKAVGIIAEYNPFHNGHLYQIKQIKERFPKHLIVVAMSGNFLQRGEPAFLDKWQRAQQALSSGVDLIVEIPTGFCMQAADRFAFAGVQILAALDVEYLAFGSEHSEYDFMELARQAATVTGDFKKFDQSYAAAYQNALQATLGIALNQPNDLLGLAYARANQQLGEPLKLVPLQRYQAEYHATELVAEQAIASATAIRQHWKSEQQALCQQYVPPVTWETLKMAPTVVTWDDLWPLLKYKLLTTPVSELAQIYGMSEGLENRFKTIHEQLAKTATYQEFLQLVKTKRYTYTHLTRLTTAMLLNFTQQEAAILQRQPYMRLLGFSQKGQKYLGKVKKTTPLPIYTKVGQADKEGLLNLDYRSGKIYEMITGNAQDLKKSPLRYL